MTPLVEGGDVVEALGERVLGRVAVEDILDPGTDDGAASPASTLLDEKIGARSIEQAGVDEVKMRSPHHLPDALRRLRARATDATSLAAGRSTSARRSASSPRSRSASLARSSPCVRSTSVVPHP